MWCDQSPCEEPVVSDFDYHQTSKYSTSTVRRFTPGTGFGGGDVKKFPTENLSPDTSSWELPVTSFSKSRNEGLANDASVQVEPATLY